MIITKIIEAKLKKAFRGVNLKMDLIKETSKRYAELARASRWKVNAEIVRINMNNEEITLKNVPVEFVKYHNKVGCTIKAVEKYNVEYAINKNKKHPRLMFLRNTKFIPMPADFYMKFAIDEMEFTDCEIRGIFYKGQLMDLELPFSEDWEFIDKEGRLRRGVTKRGKLIKEMPVKY